MSSLLPLLPSPPPHSPLPLRLPQMSSSEAVSGVLGLQTFSSRTLCGGRLSPLYSHCSADNEFSCLLSEAFRRSPFILDMRKCPCIWLDPLEAEADGGWGVKCFPELSTCGKRGERRWTLTSPGAAWVASIKSEGWEKQQKPASFHKFHPFFTFLAMPIFCCPLPITEKQALASAPKTYIQTHTQSLTHTHTPTHSHTHTSHTHSHTHSYTHTFTHTLSQPLGPFTGLSVPSQPSFINRNLASFLLPVLPSTRSLWSRRAGLWEALGDNMARTQDAHCGCSDLLCP